MKSLHKSTPFRRESISKLSWAMALIRLIRGSLGYMHMMRITEENFIDNVNSKVFMNKLVSPHFVKSQGIFIMNENGFAFTTLG